MADEKLWNSDLAPTGPDQRTWRWYHFAALWIGMIVAVPAWMLAAGLVAQGLSVAQAALTVLLGNAIVLIPMLLIGHAGARHGIPYAVLVRASFGTTGARLPALARALVACGWYGIQTWIGGQALLTLLGIALGADLRGSHLPVLDIGLGQFIAFFAFWALQLFFVQKGLLTIRRFETWTAPFKILVCIALVWWAVDVAGGFGPIFDAPSAFAHGGAREGQFWTVFWPTFTAMVGYWATLVLNIPDFTRFAHSQRDQIVGQSIGLPPTMGLIALASVITTSATVVIYGEAIWDPVALAGRFGGPLVLLGLVMISMDTISCNIAANLVSASYDFSSIWPARVSYRTGGMITAAIGFLIMPWKLVASSDGYIFVWLKGYAVFLGPIAGILIADYWLIRRTRLAIADLYRADGVYRYRGGWNPAALIAFAGGVLPNIPGFLAKVAPSAFTIAPIWTAIYTWAWFVGLGVALVTYTALMRRDPKGTAPVA